MTARTTPSSAADRSGPAPRRALRRGRAAAIGLLVLGTALAPLGGPNLAQGQPSTSGAAGRPAQAATDRLTLLFQPVTVGPNDPFSVLLGVEGASTATEIAVDIYDRVAPDEPVGSVPDRDPLATFPVVPIAGSADDPTTPRTTGFTIELTDGSKPTDPSWGYRLDEPGVYPVRVRLRGPEGDTGVILMTAIVRLPAEGAPTPSTEVALVVPVHRPPQEGPVLPSERDESEPDDAAGPPFDAELADDLAAVLEVLAGHPDLPVTFSVTPETLQSLAADADRAELLAALRAAVEGADRQLLDGAYVSIDPAELVAGDLASELPPQISAGRQALTQLLEPPSTATWQLTERLSPDAADQLSQLGITSALLPPGAVEGGAGARRPVTLGSGPGPLRALAFDASLALGPATDDPLLAGNRAVARLAAVADEDPPPRVAVAVDPDTVDPAALDVLLGALDADGTLLVARTVDDVLATTPDPAAATLASPDPANLGGYPEALALARTRLGAYAAMVGDRSDLIAPYEARLLRSAAHELPVEERTADADAVVAALDEPFDAISVPQDDQITLGARDARFPLPITSELDHPVNVVIELESNDRLDFPRNRVEQTLRPGRQVVELAVRTRAPGATPVRITVRSPDDAVVLAESRYTIRSTAVSGVGILLTVGAALVLAGWWFRHWRRNRGTARHARGRGRGGRPDPDPAAPGAPTSSEPSTETSTDVDPDRTGSPDVDPPDPPSTPGGPAGAPAGARADATDV